jgi:hypothetical protein
MRHKRLSRAEKKAYSLRQAHAADDALFPVIFVVIMLPVVVRIATEILARRPRRVPCGPRRHPRARYRPGHQRDAYAFAFRLWAKAGDIFLTILASADCCRCERRALVRLAASHAGWGRRPGARE